MCCKKTRSGPADVVWPQLPAKVQSSGKWQCGVAILVLGVARPGPGLVSHNLTCHTHILSHCSSFYINLSGFQNNTHQTNKQNKLLLPFIMLVFITIGELVIFRGFLLNGRTPVLIMWLIERCKVNWVHWTRCGLKHDHLTNIILLQMLFYYVNKGCENCLCHVE